MTPYKMLHLKTDIDRLHVKGKKAEGLDTK
jgi:hypothetical protein